jgi:hypothetical protein
MTHLGCYIFNIYNGKILIKYIYPRFPSSIFYRQAELEIADCDSQKAGQVSGMAE